MNGPVVEEAVVRLIHGDDVLFEWRCTPAQLDALVVGRLYCEGLIHDASIVDELTTEVIDDIITIVLEAPLDSEEEPRGRTPAAPIPDAASFAELYRTMFQRVDEQHEGGGMHAAALARAGVIAFQAADVGRHVYEEGDVGLDGPAI